MGINYQVSSENVCRIVIRSKEQLFAIVVESIGQVHKLQDLNPGAGLLENHSKEQLGQEFASCIERSFATRSQQVLLHIDEDALFSRIKNMPQNQISYQEELQNQRKRA